MLMGRYRGMIMSGYWNEYDTGTCMRDKLINIFVTHFQHCEHFTTDLYYTSRSSIKILRDEANPFFFIFFHVSYGKPFQLSYFGIQKLIFFCLNVRKFHLNGWFWPKRAFWNGKNFHVYILNECRYWHNFERHHCLLKYTKTVHSWNWNHWFRYVFKVECQVNSRL